MEAGTAGGATVRETIKLAKTILQQADIPNCELDVEVLMRSVLNMDKAQLILALDQPLTTSQIEKFWSYIERRRLHEPVAYIIGEKPFFTDTFKVNKYVLIPRPETEWIVEKAIEWIALMEKTRLHNNIRIVDLGTGSGCIGLSILKNTPNTVLIACDSSQMALDVAEENANRLGVKERVGLMKVDLNQTDGSEIVEAFDQFHIPRGYVDLVVANPPYISPDDPEVESNVKEFEPHEALFSKDQGLAHIKKWAKLSAEILDSEGLCLFEIGHRQGSDVMQIFTSLNSFEWVKLEKDLSSKDRYIQAIRRSRG